VPEFVWLPRGALTQGRRPGAVPGGAGGRFAARDSVSATGARVDAGPPSTGCRRAAEGSPTCDGGRGDDRGRARTRDRTSSTTAQSPGVPRPAEADAPPAAPRPSRSPTLRGASPLSQLVRVYSVTDSEVRPPTFRVIASQGWSCSCFAAPARASRAEATQGDSQDGARRQRSRGFGKLSLRRACYTAQIGEGSNRRLASVRRLGRALGRQILGCSPTGSTARSVP
jgi:hypothetical protein